LDTLGTEIPVLIVSGTINGADSTQGTVSVSEPGAGSVDIVDVLGQMSAGVGDALLLNQEPELRKLLGITGVVDPCSAGYSAGTLLSLTVGGARVAYSAAAKGLSVLAASQVARGGNAMAVAESAVANRNSVKTVFRIGFFANYRRMSFSSALHRYGTPEHVIAAAGRTDMPLTLTGGMVAAGGAMSFGGCREQ
jgi:hypothetical protein